MQAAGRLGPVPAALPAQRLQRASTRRSVAAVATSRTHASGLGCGAAALQAVRPRQRRHFRRTASPVLAMVNVDASPSVILGVGLIGAGVTLWQIRRARPWVSRDYDVVVSCVSLLVGGILIFQGWRLDPLLLFGQLMTTGAALSFAVEALRLRGQVYEAQEKEALSDAFRRNGPPGSGGAGLQQLPPPEQAPWGSSEQGWAQQWQQTPGQQQQQQPAAGGFPWQQQQPPMGESPSGSSAYSWDGGQQQQQGEYGGQPVVEAEYYAPPPPPFGGPGPSSSSGDGYYGYYGDGSPDGVPPSEVVFPAAAAYDPEPGGFGGGGATEWTDQDPGGGGMEGSAYDMEDWD